MEISMSLLKFAYVRGAQNALVSSGAIQPYRSEAWADLAVKLAAMAITDESAEDVSDEELAQAMAAMASNSEEDLSAEEIAEVLEAAGDGQEELEELLSGDSSEMDEEAAREVVAYLKSASQAQITGVANSMPTNVPDFQGEGGARANAGYAHLNGRQGLADPKKNATPFTGAQKPLAEGVSLDAKTAAAILRKLSEDAASGGAANALGGAGMNGSSSDYQTEEDPRKNPAYANVAQGLAKGDSNASPFTGSMTSHKANNPAGQMDLSSGDSSKSAALNYLLMKTAEEVGPFLPTSLNQRDKLAALRAMVGMSQPERAQYIQRIKWAMEDEDSDSEDSSDDEGMLTDEEKKLPKALRDEIIAKKKSEDKQEKEASYILRQLGLGY
jgi:hypothetical protein